VVSTQSTTRYEHGIFFFFFFFFFIFYVLGNIFNITKETYKSIQIKEKTMAGL
jgi:hypothetical protein